MWGQRGSSHTCVCEHTRFCRAGGRYGREGGASSGEGRGAFKHPALDALPPRKKKRKELQTNTYESELKPAFGHKRRQAKQNKRRTGRLARPADCVHIYTMPCLEAPPSVLPGPRHNVSGMSTTRLRFPPRSLTSTSESGRVGGTGCRRPCCQPVHDCHCLYGTCRVRQYIIS